MKLSKENFRKSVTSDGAVLYTYECEGNSYNIRIDGTGSNRLVSVYKNDEYTTNFQDVFKTTDNVVAWSKLEEMLDECSAEQSSSGGYMKNPQANPQALPLFAVTKDGSDYKVVCFLQTDKEQVVVGEFSVTKFEFDNNSVFELDWSDQQIPDFFKCVVLFKRYENVVFEANPEARVFLFLPTSIASNNPDDGGDATEQGGKTEEVVQKRKQKGEDKGEKEDGQKPMQQPSPDEGGEPSDEDGEPTKEKGKPSGKGKPTDEEGEPTKEKGKPSGKGKPTDEEGEPTDEKGEPSDKGKPTDEEGEPTDEKGQPSDEEQDEKRKGKPAQGDEEMGGGKRKEFVPTDVLEKLSNSVNMNPSVVRSFFKRVNSGETFLLTNNFNKIKSDLGLPSEMTARQLSEIINKEK